MHANARAPPLSTRRVPFDAIIAVLGRRPAAGAVARQRGRCDEDDSGGHHAVEPLVGMYTAPHPASTAINGMASDMIDGSGTINPAALNTPGNDSLRPPLPPPAADAREHMGRVQSAVGNGGARRVVGCHPAVMGTCLVRPDGLTTRLANVVPCF